MVRTYNLFVGEYICRSHIFERAQFWCTALICTHTNKQCFIPPLLVQQITHSITTYHMVVCSTIDSNYIWTAMGGLSVTYKVGLTKILECGRVEGTNTIMFINKEDIPTTRWRDVTYGRIVVCYILLKKDPNITIITVWGDIVHYPRY